MEKNGEYIGDVLSLGSEGEGVIKCGDYTVFVPFCLVGERVSFKVIKINKNIAYGKLLKVLTPSKDRALPVCENFGKCGGCMLQHMAYSAQLDFKRVSVANCLKKIGGIEAEVNPCVPAPKEWGYRNKLVLPVGLQNGDTVMGFYAPRSHRIVPVDSCALQPEWAPKIISALKKFMKKEGLSGYDEGLHSGDIRHLVVREIGGKFIITIVATKRIKLENFAKSISEVTSDSTLLLNINAGCSNIIFGEEWHICRGEGFFYGEDLGIKFKAGANTFVQVNDGVRQKLYESAVAAAPQGAVAIDLYSGGGMLTALLARKCGLSYGIEIVKEAVLCADELKILNNLQDKMFNICGAVEDNLQEVFNKTSGAERVIICDPPRKGMERSVVQSIIKSGADKLILISCDAATLSRDLGLLCGTLKEEEGKLVKTGSMCGAYKIESITPFDMFPQTRHVETLVILNKD